MFFLADELEAVRRFYAALPNAPASPLVRLPGLAAELGLADVLVKDESDRFGLPAFKIVGARYAVGRLLDAGVTGDFACATSGNHGRAVARAARLAGWRAHVFVPRGTVPARIAAIRSEGADVVVTSADYDETVRLMATAARERGWTIVSDTGWDDYDQIPRWIMAGYTWMLEEAAMAWDAPPDLVVVQAGVGSLAGGVAGWLEAMFPAGGPKLVVVEPEGSACVAASLGAGRRIGLEACAPSAMAGLRCAEVSPIAWPVLRDRVNATVQITDEDARAVSARLASPTTGDPAIASGISGAASLAGLVRLVRDPHLPDLRAALGLSAATRALVFNTEGPTDAPAVF